MIERRGQLFVGGRLAVGRVRCEAGRIAAVELEPRPRSETELPVVSPGFCDLHVHGFGGCEPLTDLAGMARALARQGTTSFQPTLFPAAPAELGRQAEALSQAAHGLGPDGARVVGLHLEGPFVNPLQAGALCPEDLAEPSRQALRQILGPATGDARGVRTMTVAPELPGARDLVRELAASGIRASLGHSRANAAEARAALELGAAGITHLYNAMRGFHHREPGLAGIALVDGRPSVELIGDLVHASREAVELALAACGRERLCLVSDALPGAGTGCDVFHVHGREHRVRDGAAWLAPPERPGAPEEEWRLGGAVLSQLQMIRQLVGRGVTSLEDALAMATLAPARALGLQDEIGVLAPGARADLVVLDGTTLELLEVVRGGVS